MSIFKRIRRRIMNGRGYNDETDAAIREALSRSGRDVGPDEYIVEQPQFILKNEKSGTLYTVVQSSRFKTDLERMIAGGADISDLEAAAEILANGGILPKRYRDHKLKGAYKGARECHIRPDWLLIYSVDRQKLILREIRTGSHSYRFGE